MSANKWTKALQKFEAAVDFKYDSFAPENCSYTPSPSVNWIFANKANGIPKGSAVLLSSEAKSGKSLLIQAAIAEMHRRDPEGIAIIFNSEMRGAFQSGTIAGVDLNRLVIYDTNRPEEIFDFFEKDVQAMIQEGMPLRIVAIDSLNAIGGTKSMVADRSVNDHLIGDQALTLQKGLQKFLPIVRKHKLTMFAVAQVRANIDGGSYGPKEKMAATFATKHGFDYFVSLRKANAADDKQDMEGNKFENEDMKDLRGNKEITGHRIIVKMEQSSFGTPGRVGMLTLDYKKGIINQHEEVFLLAYNTGVIKREGVSNYVFEDVKINGKGNFNKKMKEDQEFTNRILQEVIKKDAQ